MRFKLTTITILFCQVTFSQNLRDTTYFKYFETFIHSTETLIKESQKQKNSKPDSINFYANEVKTILRKLDSIDRFSFSMANYFEDGKRARSRDLSSSIAQSQCSYSHYMQNLRYARDSIPAIVKASLILESHLKNGFPPSIYFPLFMMKSNLGLDLLRQINP